MSDSLSYAKAGVDIDVTDAAKRNMADSIDRGDRRVLNRLGAFASLVDGRFEGYERPVLVLKTDEPGSKQKLAFELGRVTSIAFDLVNHLLNDIVVMGAEPLYVQDCIVCGTIDPTVVKELVDGLAEACRAQGCVLTGGETSVQPGVVADGVYVLSASAIGVVEEDRIIDGSGTEEGDVVLAVASNGLHTNGYTLVRKLLDDNPSLKETDVDGESFLDVVMRPHKCYYHAMRELFGQPGLKAFAHITGGGIADNLNRVLPASLDAAVDLSLLRVPAVFGVIRAEGKVSDADMVRTFNGGVGLAVVCSPAAEPAIIDHMQRNGCPCYAIGKIVTGSGKVQLNGAVAW
ncbi:MAG: phosphoribosylformylglycinamidine cyclo-ligase [Candidatus Latescibacterota bacterium]|nr:phosphoribosylformylglycinamidine cyclo-ligase [Candidatus Latescibacterota bacterium]